MNVRRKSVKQSNISPSACFSMKKHELNKIINRWRDYYAGMGVSPEEAEAHLNYAVPLLKQDLPPIFDLFHLGLLLGVNQDFLISAVNGPESFYRTFSIPKRSGGSREITAP